MIIDITTQDDLYCKYENCRRSLGEKYKTRKYCNNNDKCKNAHHAAKTKQELNKFRDEHSFNIRRDHAITCLNKLCKREAFRDMPIEEFEMMNFDLSDGIFLFADSKVDIVEFTIDQYIIFYSFRDSWIYIYKLGYN